MTRLQTSLLLLMLPLSGSLALAQEVRTGVVGESRPQAQITNASELQGLDLLPKGYAYVFTGKVRRSHLEVERISLRSPDGKTQISLERMEEQVGVTRRPMPSAKLVLRHYGRDHRLERNRGSELDRYLDRAVYDQGAGTYTLRGWAITRTVDGRATRSLLLDGIAVKVERLGLDPVWAERVHDSGQTVLLEAIGSVQRSVKAKHVEVKRSSSPPLSIPAFHGHPDEVQQRGTIGARRASTSIANYGELSRLGVFVAGDRYSFTGATRDRRFEVAEIGLEAPDQSRSRSLERFEGVYQVRQAGGRLVLQHESRERTLERNEATQLERYLARAVRAQGPGEFKLRGWLITTQTATGETATALLDGVEVEVARKGLDSIWAERVYNGGRTVLLEPTGDVQLAVKSRFVEVVRRAPRAGLVNALSGR